MPFRYAPFHHTATVGIILTLVSASLFAAEPTSVSPVPPVVAEASDEGTQSLGSIRLPSDWNRELFAAEPLVANVVAFDVDNRGRLFVCETFRQSRGVTDNRAHDDTWLLADLAARTVQDRIDYHKRLLGDAAVTYTQQDDRIRRLIDSDGDGEADQVTVVADGFNHLEEGTGAGVLVRGNKLYFTCIPKLWQLSDDDDDGKAEKRTALSDGYGVRVAFRGHDMHGLIIGPDGRLYFSIGDRGYYVTKPDGTVLSDPASGAVFRCELDGSNLEVFARGLRNPQELAFNDYGDLFTGDNNSDSGDKARLVQIVPGADSGWRMHYQYLSDRGPFNREKIWHPYHDEQPAYIVPPIANLGDGPSGFAFDPGTGVDSSARGKFYLCDFGGGTSNSGIRSFTLEPQGAFYKLGNAEQPIWNVMATDVAFGPDGALWVSDWVQGWEGIGKGRIYRFTGPEFDAVTAKQVKDLLSSDFDALNERALVVLLSHADRRIRNEATWSMAKRRAVESLLSVAVDTKQSRLARLHAVWGLEQIVRKSPAGTPDLNKTIDSVAALMSDQDEYVRATACQFVGQHGFNATNEKLATLLQDPSTRVQAFAAFALANQIKRQVHSNPAFDNAVSLLKRNDNQDPVLRHAGVMLLAATGDAARIAELKNDANLSVRRAAVVALRRLGSDQVSVFLQDASPLVVAEAARAIHDQPIPAALAALAKKLSDSKVTDEAVIRRALNANYRLGDAESADTIASFAASPVSPMDIRLEALKMLAQWNPSDSRDRVLGDHRPLAGERDVEFAKAALAKVLPTILKNADQVRDEAVSIAADYGMAQVTPFLEQRVGDKNLHPDTRALALASLTKLQPAKAYEVATGLLDSNQNKLRITALETAAKINPAASVEHLKTATQAEATTVRQAAWDLLAKINLPEAQAVITSGVQSYLKGDFPADTSLNLIEAVGSAVPAEQATALKTHQAKLENENPLGKWWSSLEGGDSVAGSEIFKRTQLSCVRCHRVDRVGGEVGPVLTTIGKDRDRRYLLESICLPDAMIAKGFETAVIADDLGQTYTGIIRSETKETVELMLADGTVQTIEQDAIVGRKRGKSAMPEDLSKLMTARELRDLVAYLASLKIDPRGSNEKE